MEDISDPKHNRYQTPEKEATESIRPGVKKAGALETCAEPERYIRVL